VLAGEPGLAIGNAIGGIAAQTAFFAAADSVTTRDLRRTAASLPNLLQASLVLLLLGMVLTAMVEPSVAIGPIHVLSPLIVLTYLYGLWVIRRARDEPQWRPVEPLDEPEPGTVSDQAKRTLWLQFAGLALTVGLAGWGISVSSLSLAAATGLGTTLFGTIFTAIATSSPELVTAVAAVRAGHPRLGAGDVLGGNSFDILLLVIADVVYVQGPIFGEMDGQHRLMAAVAMMLGALVLIGLLRRGGARAGRLALESVLIVILYAAGMAFLFIGG
jgi:cation:H+ antiporter